jgi:hypothetical protein
MELRTIKSGVLKRVLAPAGFVKGKHSFVRRRDGQVHIFDIQHSKYGGQYFVNLAFHYEFLPPSIATNNEGVPAVQDYDVTDCLVNARPGWLAGVPNEIDGCNLSHASYGYADAGREEEERCVDLQARESITILDRLGEKWRDPMVLLDLLPLELIEEDLAFRLDRANKPPTPLDHVLGGWTFDFFMLAYALSVIATRAGRADLAGRYRAFAHAQALERGGHWWVETLEQWNEQQQRQP